MIGKIFKKLLFNKIIKETHDNQSLILKRLPYKEKSIHYNTLTFWCTFFEPEARILVLFVYPGTLRLYEPQQTLNKCWIRWINYKVSSSHSFFSYLSYWPGLMNDYLFYRCLWKIKLINIIYNKYKFATHN